ncbi:30S ribosome-binding factor RbfA [Fluviispira vulneris]|uniref:30S ribosome-binding factor RbfA n=1 Tax=Fluviispira vulneris TaxID=2763012 RepID=UPI001645ECC5|nr:30S ribosome-binding factor RbfA [Fluviispira vulneris]
MATKRMLQIGEQIREHIAMMFVKGEIADPRVRGITLNSVKLTPDLQIARVYYSILGDKNQRKSAEAGLKQASGYIRREIGKVLQIRYTPHIVFLYDDSVEHAVKMGALINKISDERREDESNRNAENLADLSSEKDNSSK